MSVIPPSTLPRAARVLRPAVAPLSQFRCLHAPPQLRPAAPQKQKDQETRQFQQQQRRPFHASPTSLDRVKNPYDVLGVDKSASTSEIKKAYYTAAKKYHPDSSKEPNAREKFQEVQAAYEILSDPEKKAQFDQFGESAFDPNAGPNGFHPGAGHPFGAGFGGFSGFGGGPFSAEFSFEDLFNAATGQAGRRGRGPFAEETLMGDDINVQATISFMEAAKGTTIDINVSPKVKCKTCSGSGMKTGTRKKECGRCGGTGTRVHFMRGGFQMAATCDACGGNGVIAPPGSECPSCDGLGVVTEPSTVNVSIPPGVEDGMRMRVAGEGDAPPTGAASDGKTTPKSKRGDLFVHIVVEPHPKFQRKGSDIFYTATIPMTTALLGGVVKIPTLDGEVELRVPTGTNTGDRIVMSGMGMKKLSGGRRGGSGDLKIEFKVNMPKALSPSQRVLLEMLADEFKDKSAKRIMNVSQYANEPSAPQQQQDQQGGGGGGGEESHHGLLKRIWDKLTHRDKQGGDEGKST